MGSEDVSLLITRFIATRNRANGRTREVYERNVSFFLKWCADQGIDLHFVTEEDVRVYLRIRETDGLSYNSSRQHFTSLRLFYGWLAKTGRIAQNPLDEYVLPHSKLNPRLSLTIDDLKCLWGAAVTPQERALVGLLAFNAMRVDDVEKAHISHIDTLNGFTILRLPRKAGRVLLPYTTLASETAADIQFLIRDRSDGPIFTSASGEAFTRRQLDVVIKRVARAAGLSSTVSATSLSRAVTDVAIEQGFSYASVVRTAGDCDSRRLAQKVVVRDVPPSEHASLKMRNLIVPVGQETLLLDRAVALMEDGENHPAISTVLAGATLESYLRDYCRELNVDIDETDHKPSSLAAYGESLRRAGILQGPMLGRLKTVQSLRNDAAHGWFERVTIDDARAVEREVRTLISVLDRNRKR